MVTRPLIVAAALLATGLGACSRSTPEAPPAVENAETDASAISAPDSVNMSDAEAMAPVAADLNAVAEVPPPAIALTNGSADDAAVAPPPPSPDQQTMDDAAATGMTARTSRDGSASDEASPSDIEKK